MNLYSAPTDKELEESRQYVKTYHTDSMKADSSSMNTGSLPTRIGKELLEGLLSGGRDIANLPHTLYGKIPALAPTDPDYYEKMLGIQNPGIAGSLIEGIGQLPFYMVGAGELSKAAKLAGLSSRAADLAGMLGTSTVLGAASQPTSPGEGAAFGAAGGLLGAALGKGVSQAARPIGKYLGKALQKTEESRMQPTFSQNVDSAFEDIGNNYKIAKDNERSAWDRLSEASKGVPFDESEYKNFLNNLKDKLHQSSRNQVHLEEQVSPSIAEIDKLIHSPIHDMSDAVAHRKAINSIIGSTRQGGQSKLSDTGALTLRKVLNSGWNGGEALSSDPLEDFDANGGIKGAFDKAIELSINKTPEAKGLRDLLNDANQATQSVKDFQTIANLKGKPAPSLFYSLYSHGIDPSDAQHFVSELANVKTGGVENFEKLGRMIGDVPRSKSIIKQRIFEKAYDPESQEVRLDQFYKDYNKLSDQQKAYLFSSHDRSRLNIIYNLSKQYPDMKNKLARVGYFVAMHSPGGALGAFAGYHAGKESGAPEWLGALAGAASGEALQTGLEKVLGEWFAKYPVLKDKVISMVMNPKKPYSLSGKALRSYPASALSAASRKREPMNMTLNEYLRKEHGSS